MSLQQKIAAVNRLLLPGHLFHAPEWLVLGVNNVCNLHCKMCDVGTGYTESNFSQNLVGSHPLQMPLELIQKIMDQAALHYPKAKMGYAFTEPLVYTYLFESLNYAKQKNLYTALTTNALTLPQKAEDLCKAGLNEIFISLDGPEATHNFIRGNKNSFQKAIEGIEKLLTFRQRPEISVFCVITEWNTGELKTFADFFKKYPLKQLGFMHTNFTPQPVVEAHNRAYGQLYPATLSNTEETNMDGMNLELLLQQINEISKEKYPFPVTFSPELHTQRELDVFYRQPEKIIGKHCNDVFRNIMIKSDGTVIPAHGRCYNLTIGNLYQQSLPQIWNSEVISRFRKTLMQAGGLLPACSRCCSAF